MAQLPAAGWNQRPSWEVLSGTVPVAQLNIARLLAPIDSPQLAGFVEQLEPINLTADWAPGFVWRLQTDEGDATSIRPFDDDHLMLNGSANRFRHR